MDNGAGLDGSVKTMALVILLLIAVAGWAWGFGRGAGTESVKVNTIKIEDNVRDIEANTNAIRATERTTAEFMGCTTAELENIKKQLDRIEKKVDAL